MEMRRRAYTVVEVLVYLACFALVGTLLASIYRLLWRTEKTTEATYEVTGQAHSAVQSLRAELEETALGSVRWHAGSQSLSFCSARDQKGNLVTSEYGTPRWQKSVLYQAQAQSLLRWEKGSTQTESRNPFVLDLPVRWSPSEAKTVLRDLTPSGFRVQFVQRERGEGPDQLVDTNPVFNQDKPVRNTRLIQVEFQIASGTPPRDNRYEIRWKVSPRY